MGQTLQFRLGPFPVSVEPSFFIVSLVLAANRLVRPAMLLEWVVVVFVSVLVHELGHALAARAVGLPARISLHGAGGTTHHQPPQRDSVRQDVLISLAGPAAGFLLGALAWVWSLAHPLDTGPTRWRRTCSAISSGPTWAGAQSTSFPSSRSTADR